MTSHCYIEEAGILDSIFFDDECCSHESAAPVTGDPCETGCKMVESTGFKYQAEQTLVIPAFLLLIIAPVSALPPLSPPSVEITRWPPERLRLAQFDARTALPTRAPSFHS